MKTYFCFLCLLTVSLLSCSPGDDAGFADDECVPNYDFVPLSESVVYDSVMHSVCHRGFNRVAPENTMAAFRLARELGFCRIETDVAFTKDRVPVLIHDDKIDRTSNGEGAVEEMTFDELRQYDFGRWKAAEYAGERIPSVKEFLLWCRDADVHPYLELKAGNYTRSDYIELVYLVNDCGMSGKVTYISFSEAALRAVADCDYHARLGYLVCEVKDEQVAVVRRLQKWGNEVFLDSQDYSAEAVARCEAEQIAMEVWVINDPEVIRSLPDYVTGVTSDYLIAGKVRHG